MLNTFLKLSVVTLAAMAVTGCYRDLPDAPTTLESAGETPPAEPGSGDGTPAAPTSAAAPSGPAAALDFGPQPKGGPSLNAVTCPALTMPAAALASTVYVDASATGPEAGTKVAPFRTLAKAFGGAAPRGVIWVAAGTYPEQLIVPGKDLTVLGGFARGFATRTNACATVLEAPNANAPVFAAPSSVKSFTIEGMTIQKGVRGLVAFGDSREPGSFTIARCVFAENGTTTTLGGAVSLDGVNARIFGSVFRNNHATKGAAVASGGNVTLTIDQNVFDHNLGYSDHGGALYISAQKTKISRNTFRGNATGVGLPQGGGWGGALIVYSNSLTEVAKADLSYNVFTDNLAGIGGAVFVDDGSIVTMSHDLLYRNRSYPEGGVLRGSALYVDGTGYQGGGSTFTAEYLTVVNNNYDAKGAVGTASAMGGNVYVEGFSKASFTRSIFWNNGANPFYVGGGQASLLTIDDSVAATSCMSATSAGLAPASSTICSIAASVSLPSEMDFGDEGADDYREKPTAAHANVGAFAL